MKKTVKNERGRSLAPFDNKRSDSRQKLKSGKMRTRKE